VWWGGTGVGGKRYRRVCNGETWGQVVEMVVAAGNAQKVVNGSNVKQATGMGAETTNVGGEGTREWRMAKYGSGAHLGKRPGVNE